MTKYSIYEVGGSIRDELLGIQSKGDIDYAIEGLDTVDELIEYSGFMGIDFGYKIHYVLPKYLKPCDISSTSVRCIRDFYGEDKYTDYPVAGWTVVGDRVHWNICKLPDGRLLEITDNNLYHANMNSKKYFVQKGRYNGKVCDFVLCRKDGIYRDNRHPDTVQPGSILDDLSRRDFTINAIARDTITGNLIDPFNGRKDINAKVLRTIQPIRDTILQDSLRFYRLLRFYVTLPNFTFHGEVTEYLYNDIREDETVLEAIKNTEPQRVLSEYSKMFSTDPKRAMLIICCLTYSVKDIMFPDYLKLKVSM